VNLTIEHIRKVYAERAVLNDCTYAFTGSTINVIMGPNGCGKSTLLRICSFLEPPDSGNLLFSDGKKTLCHDSSLQRRMTLVLPRTGVFNTTVFNNVAYGLKIRNTEKRMIAHKAQEALAFVGLEHKTRQRALTLSSGETQRLGIARALAVQPEILFLDEPTASVDEENTAIIESIITGLRRNGRTMIIMTTHDRDQADRLADQLIFIEHGCMRTIRP